jgi:hypothetical protein
MKRKVEIVELEMQHGRTHSGHTLGPDGSWPCLEFGRCETPSELVKAAESGNEGKRIDELYNAPWTRVCRRRRVTRWHLRALIERRMCGVECPQMEGAAKIEAPRLAALKASLQAGIRPSKRRIRVIRLHHGSETRWVHAGDGHHRIIVLSALGIVKFEMASILDVSLDDVEQWPGVLDGRWTPDEAVAHFHCIFSQGTNP